MTQGVNGHPSLGPVTVTITANGMRTAESYAQATLDRLISIAPDGPIRDQATMFRNELYAQILHQFRLCTQERQDYFNLMKDL